MKMISATMSGLSGAAATHFGQRVAMTVIETGEEASFAAIDDLAGRYASGLASLGIDRGDRVVLHLPNGIGWTVVYHAIARLGAVVVPANILLTPAEISHIVADAGAKVLITIADRGSVIEAMLARGGQAAAMVVHEDATAAAIPPAMTGFPPREAVTVDPGDLFTIAYTSGTTGKPKGAMLTHEAVYLSTATTATLHVRSKDDRILSALPFPHVYGNVVLNSAFLTGARLFVMPRFDATSAMRAIETHRITLFEGVPAMYYQLLSHPDAPNIDFGSLSRCTVGGQTIPVAMLEEIEARLGCPVLELWGMTEVAGPATSHSPYWPARLGTIGLPFPGLETRISDLEDPSRTVRDGEAGELHIRGAVVTKGYWNQPDATREALDGDGWFATGDVAIREPGGYLRIVDRRKDVIITGGYNIYPAELEQVLAEHPSVAMVAVAGVADHEKGELAKAFVVLRPDADCSEEILAAHCRQRLAAYKQPRAFAFVEDLPRNSTGKILRRALRGPESSELAI